MEKIITKSLNNQKGIIKNLLEKEQIPTLFIDNSSHIDDNPIDPYVMYKNQSSLLSIHQKTSPIDLDIDFHKYSVIITDYIITVTSSQTPPAEWKILGRNEETQEWSLIDYKLDNNLCLNNSELVQRCDNEQTTTFHIDHPIGPFRQIKFSVLKDRGNTYNPSILDDYKLKILYFDIFGIVCNFKRYLCLNTCNHKLYSSFINLAYLYIFIFTKS